VRVESLYQTNGKKRTKEKKKQNQSPNSGIDTKMRRTPSPLNAICSNKYVELLAFKCLPMSIESMSGWRARENRVQPCVDAIRSQWWASGYKEKRQLLSSRN
jgi:hypothetical protein